MKYALKTEINENGNLVFSKQRYGKGYVYWVKDENGNIRQALKDWIIAHQNEIVNVRVSGDSLCAVEPKKKIEDFGQKIGGAKKDLWKSRGLSIKELEVMTMTEREKLITRDNVWLKPNIEKMVNEEGYDSRVVYYICCLRNAILSRPKIMNCFGKEEILECQADYVELVGQLRDRILQMKKLSDVDSIGIKWLLSIGVLEETFGGYRISRKGEIAINNKFLNLVQWNLGMLERNPDANNFMSSESKGSSTKKDLGEDSERKKAYYASELVDIKRTGKQHRQGNIEGQDFVDTFGIRGGEFGNWVNEVERQENMNFAFESFCDLADVLGIPYSEIGLKGHLGIAFGARGSGRVVAHYEPLHEVINLTKMKGAGSLAHEYFHAIDNLLGNDLCVDGFISKSAYFYAPMQHLLDVITKKPVSVSENGVLIQKDLENVERGLSCSIKNILLPTKENKGSIELMVRKYVDLAKKNAYMGGTVFLDYVPKGSRMVYVIADEMNELFTFIEESQPPMKLSEQKKHILAKQVEAVRVAYLNSAKEMKEVKYVKTDFKVNADSLDKFYAKSGHGTWGSEIELCARAFACYVKDKLAENGVRNDYLCGHADTVKSILPGNKIVYGYPRGQERVNINKAFDEFFEVLRTSYLKK